MTIIYPTLLTSQYVKSHVDVDTKSWFDMKKYSTHYKYNTTKESINTSYTDTIKIIIYPDANQHKILQYWFNDCIDIYNLTNSYLKRNIMKNLNWINIRKSVNNQIKDVCKQNKLGKHTGDYACKHCVEMWKSAISNHGLGNKFTIKKMLKTRTRKNLIIEPGSVNKTGDAIFVRNLGLMKSNLPLSLITKNSVLQYNNNTHQYTIIVPQDKDDIRNVDRSDKVGIDIGVRTFLTTFSDKETLEIGTCDKTYPLISKYLKKIDSIRSNANKKTLMTVGKKRLRKFKTGIEKYYQKIRNKIDDMHNRVASYLVRNYKEIIIGKVSTKKMVNNETSSLQEITKRRLLALSHYRFRIKLTSMAEKFDSTITLVTEYLTSKTCCNCGNINDSLGSSKVYRCLKCPIEIDRDINAAINIYENKNLSR